MHIKVGFLTHRFAGINSLTDFLKDVSLTTVCITGLTPYVM